MLISSFVKSLSEESLPFGSILGRGINTTAEKEKADSIMQEGTGHQPPRQQREDASVDPAGLRSESDAAYAHSEAVPPASASTEPALLEQKLKSYLATLINLDELSELILLLEARLEAPTDWPLADPGLQELQQLTGFDSHDPEELRLVILAVGQRMELLRSRQDSSHGRAAPPVLSLSHRDVKGVADVLVSSLQKTDIAGLDPTAELESLQPAVQDALHLLKRNLPARDASDQQWWDEVSRAAERYVAPAFIRAKVMVNKSEDHPVRGQLLRFPVLMGILASLFGLVTVGMRISTPLVMLVLGLFGYFVVHPAWKKYVHAPIKAIEKPLVDQQRLFDRLARSVAWQEQDFTIARLLSDLWPVFEGERLAGRTSLEHFQQVIRDHFDRIRPHFAEVSSRGDAYFSHLQRYFEGVVARRVSQWATSRNRLHESSLGPLLDYGPASSAGVALVTLPLALMMSAVSPFPEMVDFPLAVLLLAWVGWRLPPMLHGTNPSRVALSAELEAFQAELDNAP